MRKLFTTLIVLLIVSFILGGCGNESAQTPGSKSAAQTTKSGGTLKIYIQEPTVLGFPPKMNGTTDSVNSSVAVETLFIFDKQGNMVPHLAKAWKSDPVAKTLTITLNKGIKFHDGTDFNAEAVKWNLDNYQLAKKPELRSVKSVDVVDNDTVRINFSTFDNTVITNLANGISSYAGRMISPTAFKKNGEAWAEKNPVGTGPFQFISWTKDVGIKWKRFDEYWGGKPYIDGIDMIRYADPTVALMDFKAGNLDILYIPDPKDVKELEATGKYNVVVADEGQMPELIGYAKDPKSPFAKLEVRQALSYAIDAEAIAKSFGLGYYKVQNQWAVPGSWSYNPKVVGYPYNPAKAKELLAAAGYPNGFDTTLNFFNISQAQVDESLAMQKMLKDVGINAKLNPMTRPAFSEAASKGKGWDGILRMQKFSSPDPLLTYALEVGSKEAVGMYLPDEFKQVYDKGIAADTFEGKQELVHQLMSLATDKYSMATFLYMQPYTVVKSKRIHDDLYCEVPGRYLSSKVWISE